MRTTGLSYIIFTVGDVERSRAFYEQVLGFHVENISEGGFNGFSFGVGDVWLFFGPSRQSQPDDRFSEFRIGLDHLAFVAPDRAALDELVDTLRAAGVPTNGVETFAPTGNLYVAFRDPDNIQLEYWLNR